MKCVTTENQTYNLTQILYLKHWFETENKFPVSMTREQNCDLKWENKRKSQNVVKNARRKTIKMKRLNDVEILRIIMGLSRYSKCY